MDLKMTVDGLAGVQSMLSSISQRRINAVVATALTRTAVEVKAAEVSELAQSIDRPTPYTLSSIYVKPARADSLAAEVWFKDDMAGSGTPATKYLLPQVEGGQRHMKRFEKALQAAGVMPTGTVAVPGSAAKLDAYGNMSRGQIQQILSQAGTELTAGHNRTLTKGTDRASRTKQRNAYGRAGGQFVAVKVQRGKLKPGIYIAEARNFGAKLGLGRTGKLKPVLLFVRAANYRSRFDFHGVAERVSAERLPLQVTRALTDSLAKTMASGYQGSFGW
jgi:hypothetical protein